MTPNRTLGALDPLSQARPERRPEVRRVLLTLDEAEDCPFGCSYCFARFDQYETQIGLRDVLASSDWRREDVIYPSCDSDLFTRPDAMEVLRSLAKLGVSISVSTKAYISASRAEELANLASAVPQMGVMRVGVSFATKSRWREIEPRTPSYQVRLKSLANLSSVGLPSIAVLKPLLPEVPLDEYIEILEDASKAGAVCALVGDEWLDAKSPRSSKLDATVFVEITKEPVKWIPATPVWEKRSVSGRIERLKNEGRRLSLPVFESDLDLVANLLDR